MKIRFANILTLAAIVVILPGFGPKNPETPPGTVVVSPTLYADAEETSNLSWGEYLYWLGTKNGKSSDVYKKALPDTDVWKPVNPVYAAMYLRNNAFMNYPVVGISYEQANDFLQWRSDRVNEGLHKKGRKWTVKYRLPLETEWEAIAAASSVDDAKKEAKPDEFNANLNYGNINFSDLTQLKSNDKVDFSAPVKSYKPNAFGIYNVFGNVAEMTAEKGTAKGAGFIHKKEEARVNNKFSYTKPEIWLGFRAVCEVIPTGTL